MTSPTSIMDEYRKALIKELRYKRRHMKSDVGFEIYRTLTTDPVELLICNFEDSEEILGLEGSVLGNEKFNEVFSNPFVDACQYVLGQ